MPKIEDDGYINNLYRKPTRLEIINTRHEEELVPIQTLAQWQAIHADYLRTIGIYEEALRTARPRGRARAELLLEQERAALREFMARKPRE